MHCENTKQKESFYQPRCDRKQTLEVQRYENKSQSHSHPDEIQHHHHLHCEETLFEWENNQKERSFSENN